MAKALQDCVLLFGDSLTQANDIPGNLYERFSQAYIRKLDVLNRGYGGYNTNGARVLLDEILAKKEDAASTPVIRLVTIWLGTNDSVLPPKDQTVPLDTFITNMDHILTAFTSPDSPYAVADTPVSIILITPGPCLTSMFTDYRVKWRTVESTRRFKDAVLDVGKKWKGKERQQEPGRGFQIETVDFWEAMVAAAGGEGEELRPFFTDGVHLTGKGYDVLWDKVQEVIKTKFVGRGLDWEDTDDLPLRVPWHGTFDWSHAEGLLDHMKQPQFRLKK